MRNSTFTNYQSIIKDPKNIIIFLILILGSPDAVLANDDGFPILKVVGEGYFCYQPIEKAMDNADKDAHIKAAFVCKKTNLKMKTKGVPIIKMNKEKCRITSEMEFSCLK